MKLTLTFDAQEAVATSLKIKLPRKWLDGPAGKVKESFVEAFNSKHPDAPLELGDVHLESSVSGRTGQRQGYRFHGVQERRDGARGARPGAGRAHRDSRGRDEKGAPSPLSMSQARRLCSAPRMRQPSTRSTTACGTAWTSATMTS